MSLDPKFQAASEASEHWIELIEAAHCVALPFEPIDHAANPLAAYEILLPLYYEEEVWETLQETREALAAIATPVRFSRLGQSRLYTSGHEALLDVHRLLVGLVIVPGLELLGDRNKLGETARCHFTPRVLDMMDKTGDLRALICSERAKLLRQAQPESEAKTRGEQTPEVQGTREVGSDELPADKAKVPDPWADFRDGPGGPWMTARHCWERYRVSNPVLSREAKKDRTIRRKNPAGGSGYVYRYDVVSRIANRKSLDE